MPPAQANDSCVEIVVGPVLLGLRVRQFVGDPVHVDVEERTQELTLVGPEVGGGDALRCPVKRTAARCSGRSPECPLGRLLDRLHARAELTVEAASPDVGERQRVVALGHAGPIRGDEVERRDRRQDRGGALCVVERMNELPGEVLGTGERP